MWIIIIICIACYVAYQILFKGALAKGNTPSESQKKSNIKIWINLTTDERIDDEFKKVIQDFFIVDEIDFKKYYQNERASEPARISLNPEKEINPTPTFREHYTHEFINRGNSVPAWFYTAYPDVALWFHEESKEGDWFQNNFTELFNKIENEDDFFNNYDKYRFLYRELINYYKLTKEKLECS